MKKILLLNFFVIVAFNQSYSQNSNKADSLKHVRNFKIEVQPARSLQDSIYLARYLKRALDYRIDSSNNAPYGIYEVKIKFTIFRDGQLGDFKPVTNCGYSMENEVISVMKKGPNWMPTYQNGKIMDKSFSMLSITFEIYKI